MNRGQFSETVVFQRATATTDDYGGEVQTWVDLQKAAARVRYRLASEQRQAAQEAGQQAATFELYPTAALRSVTLKDRILFNGSAWDLTEIAPLDRRTIRFTATRST